MWRGMWCGVQQLAGNVLRRSAAARACDGECGAVFTAGRELWRGVQRLAGNVAGKLALRPAAGRECGGKCGAAFSGWPGMWREMRRGVQQLAGNVAWNLAVPGGGTGMSAKIMQAARNVTRRMSQCTKRRGDCYLNWRGLPSMRSAL